MCYSSRMRRCALCCHSTPTQNGSIGWATTTGRLLGPKTALGVLQTQRRATASRVESTFRNLSITNPALDQLSCTAAAICYYLSNHSRVEAVPLRALLKDTTSELTGIFLVLHTIHLMLNVKQGSCEIPTF